jgi:hypothetical protein
MEKEVYHGTVSHIGFDLFRLDGLRRATEYRLNKNPAKMLQPRTVRWPSLQMI